jgi:hypothetical protein
MRHSHRKISGVLTALAMAISSLPLKAADPIEVNWNQVCQVANGRELTVTTANGETTQGYCFSIKVDELAVTTKDHKVVKIARSALSRIDVDRTKGHQLSSLGKGMHDGFKWGFDSMLSPRAPLGIVALPATLAWGIIAAPFCLLGDLRYKASGKQEIKLN